jgi:hypothetical protein
MKKFKSETILLIIIAIALFIIIGILLYINVKQRVRNNYAIIDKIKQNEQINEDMISLTPSNNPIYKTPTSTTPTILPTIPLPTETNPPIEYDDQATQLLLEKIKNKTPLSQNDQSAKSKILALLPEEQVSGIIYKSPNIIIDYTYSADAIEVEITTTNIDQAKQEAIDWFTEQGLSIDAICNMPVDFYLNYKIAESLRNSNTVFSPLAPQCK